MENLHRRLYLSENRRLLGVCGGVAGYFDLDPNLVRLLWALATLLYGTGLLAYVIAALLIPKKPE